MTSEEIEAALEKWCEATGAAPAMRITESMYGTADSAWNSFFKFLSEEIARKAKTKQFTSVKPTVAGFYWHRAPGEREQVCEVFQDGAHWYVAFPIGRGQYDWLSLTERECDRDLPADSEWCGPLE